jgi:hypothetical protein
MIRFLVGLLFASNPIIIDFHKVLEIRWYSFGKLVLMLYTIGSIFVAALLRHV